MVYLNAHDCVKGDNINDMGGLRVSVRNRDELANPRQLVSV